MTGSPPMPTQVDWPSPASVMAWTASYVSVPERETTPTPPSRWIEPGMIPTLALPGDVAPGQLGPIRRAPAIRTSSTTGIMSSTGMPSVMQKIVWIPAATASSTASGAPAAGTKMHEVLAPVSRTASATVLNTGTRPSSADWPPLPGVTPATSGVPYSSIARLWNSPSRPVIPWTTSRVSRPIRMLTRRPSPPRPPWSAASSRLAAVTKLAASSSSAASAALVPTIRTTIGTSRSCWARASIRPRATSSPRVMPPKMFTRIALTLVSSRIRRIAAATRSALAPPPMSRKFARLAAGPVHEVHRRHREPRAVDHAADVAVELDEREVVAAGLDVGRVLGVEVAQLLELRVAGERRVVERDLGVEADQALHLGPVGVVLLDHGERVDLHEVRVVGEHRPQQALRDRRAGLPLAAEADLERELAGRVVGHPEQGIGVLVDDRVGVLDGDLLDLDAALGRADEHQPLGRPVEHDREVVLLHDLGRGTDEDPPDGQPLDLHRQDLGRDVLGLVRGRRELDAAGLAPAADQDLGLDHDLAGGIAGVGEEADGGGARLRRRAGDLPGGDRQPLGDEQRLRVGFVDLHARSFLPGGFEGMARW